MKMTIKLGQIRNQLFKGWKDASASNFFFPQQEQDWSCAGNVEKGRDFLSN